MTPWQVLGAAVRAGRGAGYSTRQIALFSLTDATWLGLAARDRRKNGRPPLSAREGMTGAAVLRCLQRLSECSEPVLEGIAREAIHNMTGDEGA